MSFDKHVNKPKIFPAMRAHDFTADAFVSVERDPEDVLTISHLLRAGLSSRRSAFFKLRLEFLSCLAKSGFNRR